MTKIGRAPGSPIQLKDSRETLSSQEIPMTVKKSAQLVVCEYVQAWHAGDSEEDRIAVANELLEILGLLERR